MTTSNPWPFTRIMVDRLVYGTTRIWWELAADFNLPAPHTFSLQAGYTGNATALDWEQIGSEAVNAWYLADDSKRELSGKNALTHYRVKLVADGKTFISAPQPVYGLLSAKDWKTAQELLRLHKLQQFNTGTDGYLLKKMRYGTVDPEAVDLLTRETLDASRWQTFGTRFKVGYHPPVAMVVETPQNPSRKELRGAESAQTHSAQQRTESFIVSAYPMLSKEDVWVDAFTDERWLVVSTQVATGYRNVPLIQQVTMSLLPKSDIVYRIPVDPYSYDPGDTVDFQPTVGSGCVFVDHDYGENSALSYISGDCCGVAGARVRAFKLSDWTGGARTAEYAVAETLTTVNGTWAWAMKLDPGEYMLEYFLDGAYGPDTQAITVVATPVTTSSTSTSSSGSSFGEF